MMEEGLEKIEGAEKSDFSEKKEAREEIFSKAVRAGKRTYFFDVKATRNNDYYLTITESKKRFNKDGRYFFEKHKIFLYKEDFDKFSENLTEVIEFIKKSNPYTGESKPVAEKEQMEEAIAGDYTNIEFEDLDKKTD